MNLNDRVVVSALATGTGESPHGWIDDVYEFMRETFYSVRYDGPTADGRTGITLSNPGLMSPE